MMKSPFSSTYFDNLPNHPQIIQFINSKISLDYADLNQSARLGRILNKIINFILNYIEKNTSRNRSFVSFWGLHAMTLKLNILKNLLIHQLCIPQLYQWIGMGTVENDSSVVFGWFSKSASPRATDSPNSSQTTGKVHYQDFLERARAILIETFSLFVITEESHLSEG
jgi:hypothetical protein